MFQRIRWVTAGFLLATVGAGCETAPPPLDERIDAYVEEQVETRGIPGLAAAVVREGAVVYAGAFGVRELGKPESLTPDHVFHFASVSKPFVATALVQLAERGTLDLDDPVAKWLPYFVVADAQSGAITIRQMLSHTSGMPDVLDYEWSTPQTDEGAAERYVRQLASERLLWPPGEGFAYSNMAFDVLGDVIAKASGTSFEEYVRANILLPLGMERSSFLYPEIPDELRTTGHVDSPARVSDVYPYNRRHAPSSTLNSSVREMTRWMLANLNRGELNGRRILRPESYDLLWSPTARTTDGNRVGLSWILGERGGRKTVSHAGADTGFRSYLLLLPDDGLGIVMVSNWEETDREAIVGGILDVVLASEPALP